MDNLDKILEGLLFLSGDGLDRGTIMEKLQITPKQLDKAVEILKNRYNQDCGINFITYKDKLQLCASPKYADEVSQVLNPIRERQLTKATLEVMAIIAYKQPVTRLDIQDVRGINSDYAIQTLLNYKLIEVVGRKDAIGKPLLFGTTDEFLRHFGIDSLNELPDYDELMKDIQQIQLENNHLYNEYDVPVDAKGQNAEPTNDFNAQLENSTQKISNEQKQGAVELDAQIQAKNEVQKSAQSATHSNLQGKDGGKSFAEQKEQKFNGTTNTNQNATASTKNDDEQSALNSNKQSTAQSDGIDWSLIEGNPDIEA